MAEKKKRQNNSGVTRRTFLKTVGVAGVATAAVGFPAVLRGAEPEPILIGSLHPTTGPVAYDGQSIANGFQLAVDQKNEAGGIKSMGGAKLKVMLMDTQSKPKVGEAAASKLIRDGCVALSGAYNSPVTMVTTQVAERQGIPHIITISVADEILQRGFKFCFRVQPDSTNMAELTCKYIRQLSDKGKLGLKTIAHMHISGFGASIANKVQEFAPQYDFEVIGASSYGYGVSDLTTEITKIKGMNADVIFDTGYLSDGILKIRTYQNLKVEPKGGIIGCANGAYSNSAAVSELGNLMNYIMDGNYYFNPRSPLTPKIMAAYDKKFTQVRFQSHSVHAYDAGLVLIDALERAGSRDPKKIRDAMAATSLKEHMAPGAPIEFDETGQNKNAMITLQQIQDQQIRVVLPEEYSDGKPMYPFPAWSKRA
ncbi:MAG: ABC transporter substrate-binding protein [Desulfobacterales bacterium]|nr:MAG: ABC transporter substrate-binding protein [Desulfobacterales bacterium]